MKSVLLFDTAIGTANFGDEIILQSITAAMKPLLDRAQVFRLGTHIANFSALQMIKPNEKMRRIAMNVDYKLIAGTNLILDNLLYRRPQFMLDPFNAPIYKNAVFVSVGRNKDFQHFANSYTRKLYRNTFSHEFLHSTRDEETCELLESIGLKAVNTGCSTLWGITPADSAAIPRRKSARCVLTVSGNPKYRAHEADIQLVGTVLKNYETVYAWIQTPQDLDYLQTLTDIEANRIRCIYALSRYGELLSEGNIDYVGTRLHGGCFALRHGVRSIIIAVDQRSRGIHKANNIPILERSEIGGLDEMINSELITDIRVDEAAVNQFLGQFVP